MSVQVLEILFPSLNKSKNSKIFLGLHRPPDRTTVEQTTFIHLHRTLLGFFPICNIFPSLINVDFFTSGVGPDSLINVLEDYIMFLI